MSHPMLIRLCSTIDVLEGQGLQVTAADLVVAVFRVDDRYYVIDDACTHGPGRLCEGTVEGDIVECNFHNGAFNIRTGEVVSPPCLIPIRTYYAEVRDGQVCIDPERPAEP
ncbi:MAG: non-heme iron oxygenase ferredoxin subunit [Acidobacteriota bacterium]|nr:non-heme iron oxygenase ferredoxin subunit [Acidobacteriota bacterium]